MEAIVKVGGQQDIEKSFYEKLEGWGKDYILQLYAREKINMRSGKTYERVLQVLIDYLIDNGVTHPGINSMMIWKESLKTRNKIDPRSGEDTGEKLSVSAANLYITFAKAFFRYLNDYEIWPNKCYLIDRLKQSKRRGHKRGHFEPPHLYQLLNLIDTKTLEGLRNRAIILSASFTYGGLRSIEITTLRNQDFKLKDGGYILDVWGKGKTEREETYLDSIAASAIIEYQQALNKVHKQRPDDPLFCSLANRNKYGQMTTAAIRTMFNKYKNQMHLPAGTKENLSFHSLRHTAITYLREAGGSLELTQYFSRHASWETTKKYDHAIKAKEYRTQASDLLKPYREVILNGKTKAPIKVATGEA